MTKATRPAGVTRSELADRLGVNPRTIGKWMAEGMPVLSPGRGRQPTRFDLAAARDWRQARDETSRAERAEFERIRARRELAQAIEAEQRVSLRAARLIRAEDADRVWREQVTTIRRRLLRFPARVTPGLVDASRRFGAAGIEASLERDIHRLLCELAGVPVGGLPARENRTAGVG